MDENSLTQQEQNNDLWIDNDLEDENDYYYEEVIEDDH